MTVINKIKLAFFTGKVLIWGMAILATLSLSFVLFCNHISSLGVGIAVLYKLVVGMPGPKHSKT